MGWPTYNAPQLPAARPAINPDIAERLKLASDIIPGKLKRLPKKIAVQYARGLRQLAETLERMVK